jgi:hypothetical protein
MEAHDDRDMLIRVEQSLQNTRSDQTKILEDLRTIFNRLEQESKVITVISGDLKAHLESSIIRWTNIDKDIVELSRRLSTLEDKYDDITQSIVEEREERTKSDNGEREERAKAHQESENFQREVKASVNTVGWIIGALASLATIISVISIFITHK